MSVLLDAQRRSSQLYTALLGAAAAVGDWPTVEQAYADAQQQLAAGFMPQRAFRFVEGAYRRVVGGRGGREGGMEEEGEESEKHQSAGRRGKEAEVVSVK